MNFSGWNIFYRKARRNLSLFLLFYLSKYLNCGMLKDISDAGKKRFYRNIYRTPGGLLYMTINLHETLEDARKYGRDRKIEGKTDKFEGTVIQYLMIYETSNDQTGN